VHHCRFIFNTEARLSKKREAFILKRKRPKGKNKPPQFCRPGKGAGKRHDWSTHFGKKKPTGQSKGRTKREKKRLSIIVGRKPPRCPRPCSR